jgi:hypothetical protein
MFIEKNSKGNCLEKLLKTTISFQDIKDEIFSEEGLISKQLNKFHPKQKGKMIEYIKLYCEYSETKYNEVISEYKPYIIYIYNDLMKNISLGKKVNKESLNSLYINWSYVELYRNILTINKYNIVLDIYTLCRSFKYLILKKIYL